MFNDYEIIKTASYIDSSKQRKEIVKILSNDSFKKPSDLAKELDIRTNHVSRVLKDLKEEEIVICVNEEEKRGRLYKLTDKGKDAYDFIINNIEK